MQCTECLRWIDSGNSPVERVRKSSMCTSFISSVVKNCFQTAVGNGTCIEFV